MQLKNKIKIILLITIIIFIIGLFIFPIKLKNIQSSTIIYDEKNIEIGEIIKDNKIRHRIIDINKTPNFSKQAIILMEDKSFYNNIGIDFSAIIRAIKNNIQSGEKIEGASTISTQVIRNNYWLNKNRTYLRKMVEFYLAIGLNIKYSKSEILEYYLNNIYFGYLNYGIQSAAHYYFNKDINNLTKAEQISLLIIPKNPYKYNPYKFRANFNKRFKNIVNYLNTNGLINNVEKNEILTEILTFNYNHENKLPYIIDFIKQDKNIKKISKINTTIDYNLTKKIENISKNIIDGLMWKDVGDYGVILIDKKTNNLKVMIGGIDYYLENGQVNSTISKRQAGSTIKPFTYLLTFNDLGYLPDTTILDLPVEFNTQDGNKYSPKNYSLDYKGEITLAEALSQSVNIPAIKLVNKIGINRLYDFLKKLNITTINKKPEYYGLALTLGVAEMKLYELTQAYSIFANKGFFCKTNILKENNKECKKIIDEEYINMVNIILTNRYFKLKGFPINSNLDFKNKDVFIKTGTSRNFRDNWSIGFTDNYIIGVWVGNKDGTYMKGVSGATGAGEIFKEIVNYLEKDNIKKEDNKIIYKKSEKIYLEILSPLNNSIYKIDKNKPKNIQQIKLDFKTNIDYDKKIWLIDNKISDKDFYNLSEGKHIINLKLFKNKKLISNKITSIEVKK